MSALRRRCDKARAHSTFLINFLSYHQSILEMLTICELYVTKQQQFLSILVNTSKQAITQKV